MDVEINVGPLKVFRSLQERLRKAMKPVVDAREDSTLTDWEEDNSPHLNRNMTYIDMVEWAKNFQRHS